MKKLDSAEVRFLDRITAGLGEGTQFFWEFTATTVLCSHAVTVPGLGSIFFLGQFGATSGIPLSGIELLRKGDGWYPVADMRSTRKDGVVQFERMRRYVPVCNRCRGCRIGMENPKLKGVMPLTEQASIFTDVVQQVRVLELIFGRCENKN